jgi:transcriptional regulator with XRE-family HTH domain
MLFTTRANDAIAPTRQNGEMYSPMREIRLARGFTLEYVGKMAETTAQQISRLENGQRRLTLEWAIKLAPVLECSPLDLLGLRNATSTPVAIKGFIQDTEEVHEFSDNENRVFHMASSEAKEPFAVEIRGNGLWPVYRQGDLVIYDQGAPIADACGRECVVTLNDGKTLIRWLFNGSRPGLYRLVSHREPEIHDISIKSAHPVVFVRRA